MKNAFLVLLASICIAACSKKTAAKSSQATTKPTTAVATPKSMGETPSSTSYAKGIPEDIDPNLQVSLHRSPCFGYCPTFKIEVFTDGTARYNGYAHVTRLGSYTAKADAAFMKRVADKALSIKYLSLLDKYPVGDIAIADLPTVTTYIRIGKDGKRVIDNHDPPKELREFEQWLEAEFETLSWQKAN